MATRRASGRGEARRSLARRGKGRDAAARSGEQVLDYARSQASQAREKLIDRLEEQREALASALSDVASELESAGRRSRQPWSRRLLRASNRALQGASDRLDERSVEELLAQAGQAVRQRPWLSAAGLLGVGVLAGRVLRASGHPEEEA